MTRRNVLRLMSVTSVSSWTLLTAGSKAAFWNDKDAAEWSPEERSELISNSPWAKQVRADASRAEPVGPPPGTSGGNIPMRMPSSIGRGRGRGGAANFPAFTGVVRWESAKPLLLALKKNLPTEMEGHYVIGVSGFPMGLHNPQRRGDDTGETAADQLDDLKQVTTLRAKGKDPAQAGVILRRSDSDGPVFLFGFSRDVINIETKDKNVEFETQFGPLEIEAKFEPKQMLYRGELAL